MEQCGYIYDSFGNSCGRRRGHAGAHDIDEATYATRRPALLVGRWPNDTWFRQRLAYVRGAELNDLINAAAHAREQGELQ